MEEDDVVEAIGPELAARKARLSPEEFRKAQAQMIEAGLQSLVDRKLLLEQARKEMLAGKKCNECSYCWNIEATEIGRAHV